MRAIDDEDVTTIRCAAVTLSKEHWQVHHSYREDVVRRMEALVKKLDAPTKSQDVGVKHNEFFVAKIGDLPHASFGFFEAARPSVRKLQVLELLGHKRFVGYVTEVPNGPFTFYKIESADPYDAGAVHGPFGPGAVYCGPRDLTPDEQRDHDAAIRHAGAEKKAEAERKKAAFGLVHLPVHELTRCGLTIADGYAVTTKNEYVTCPKCDDDIPF